MGLSAFTCGLVALGISSAMADGISLKDDLGRAVELKHPASRVVSLAPFLTELLFSAGAGSSVVGVSAHSDYPEEARRLPQVSSAVATSLEAVAALEPDLVLAWRDSVRPEDLERLAHFGVPVFVAQARSLDDVPRLLEAIGRLTGHDAASASSAYRATLRRLGRERAHRPRIAVLLEIWHQPLTTIAGRHWINEALELCGARNAFGDLPGVAPVVPWETIYAREPRAIVGAGSAGTRSQFEANWSTHGTLGAVNGHRLVFLEADTIQRPTLRLAQGVSALCEAIDRVR